MYRLYEEAYKCRLEAHEEPQDTVDRLDDIAVILGGSVFLVALLVLLAVLLCQ